VTNITSYTRTLFGPGNDLVVFNPETVVSSLWYSLPDYIVAFEDTYTAYSSAVLDSIAAAQRPQSMFIMYGFSGTAAKQQALVDGIIGAGIGGLYVTTVPGYTAWSSLWAQFCNAMAIA
jgi:Spherulation-specific family 4